MSSSLCCPFFMAQKKFSVDFSFEKFEDDHLWYSVAAKLVVYPSWVSFGNAEFMSSLQISVTHGFGEKLISWPKWILHFLGRILRLGNQGVPLLFTMITKHLLSTEFYIEHWMLGPKGGHLHLQEHWIPKLWLGCQEDKEMMSSFPCSLQFIKWAGTKRQRIFSNPLLSSISLQAISQNLWITKVGSLSVFASPKFHLFTLKICLDKKAAAYPWVPWGLPFNQNLEFTIDIFC